jgi:hypothetical protein
MSGMVRQSPPRGHVSRSVSQPDRSSRTDRYSAPEGTAPSFGQAGSDPWFWERFRRGGVRRPESTESGGLLMSNNSGGSPAYETTRRNHRRAEVNGACMLTSPSPQPSDLLAMPKRSG